MYNGFTKSAYPLIGVEKGEDNGDNNDPGGGITIGDGELACA